MQTPAPDSVSAITFLDRPKTSLRIVTLAIWGVGAFLLYKATVTGPADPWVLWCALAFFIIVSCAVVREFAFRPTRVTRLYPLQRKIEILESAAWRNRRVLASIPRGARFEVFQCDSDDVGYFGVRIRSENGERVTVADYLLKRRAESLAYEANASLRLS